MTPQERVVARALDEVGYVPSHGKFNKYAMALDSTDIYNYPKNGYDWCDIFYDWLLVTEFGLDVAKAMTNQPSGGCGAGCEWSASYHRAANRWSIEPSLGAQVFFGFCGSESHTGVVVGYDSVHVYTIGATPATAQATPEGPSSSAATGAATRGSWATAFRDGRWPAARSRWWT